MSTSSPTDHKPRWVPVDFEKAEIQPGNIPGSMILTVTGNTPSSSDLGCPVKLAPATYVTQPEYWKIEVLWDRADAIFASQCPFKESIPLDGIYGTKGIEVVGKTRSDKVSR